MFLFASNLLTLIFSYTACCSNFYLQFFEMFKLSSDHCIFTEYKFFVVRWHIFIAQRILLVDSYLGFIEGGMYIIYIITIMRNIVKLLCQNMHWKILNFKRKMNCMTAIDLKALCQSFDILLDYFVKKIKFMKKNQFYASGI